MLRTTVLLAFGGLFVIGGICGVVVGGFDGFVIGGAFVILGFGIAYTQASAALTPDPNKKPCPACKESVHIEARRCPHCTEVIG